MENFKITKQNEKIRKKQERQKQLEKVIESHSLKYYGYFNIIFQILIFFALLFSLVFSGINLYQNKKLISYIDTNKNIQETQAYKKEIEVTPYDTITNLTGTTWVVNSSITTSSGGYDLEEENGNEETINIEFISNNVNYDGIKFRDSDFTGNAQIFYLYDSQTSDSLVYNSSWENEAYKTIQITGGTDATNSDLIDWLQNNATLQNNTPTPTQLATPVISRVDVGNDYYIQWPLVSNASDYAVILDNSVLNNAVLDYSVTGYVRYKVEAVGTYKVIAEGDGTNYSDSSSSNTITFTATTLDTPLNFSFNSVGQYLVWSSVTNADRYYILKDNVVIANTTNTTYSISATGSYQVYAYSSNFIYNNSSPTTAINIYSVNSSNSLTINDNIYLNKTLPFYVSSSDTVTLYFTITDNLPNGYFLDNNTYITTNDNATITQTITSDKTITASISNVSSNVTFSITYTTAIKLNLSITNGVISNVSINGVNQTTSNIYYLSSPTDIVVFTATANNGYIYDNENGGMTYSHLSLVSATNSDTQKVITLSSFSTGATFSIEYVEAILLTGQWAFIGSQNYSYNNLPNVSVFIDIEFYSNGLYFDGINWNVPNQYISYMSNGNSFNVFSYTYDIPNLYFSGFLYIPQNTANYYFIDFDAIDHDVYLNYNVYNDVFIKLYRVATIQDYNNLGYRNGLIDANEYSLGNMFFALFDTPIIALKSLLNFNFFGVNLFALASALITLLLVFAVFNLIKGGSSKNKGGDD